MTFLLYFYGVTSFTVLLNDFFIKSQLDFIVITSDDVPSGFPAVLSPSHLSKNYPSSGNSLCDFPETSSCICFSYTTNAEIQ